MFRLKPKHLRAANKIIEDHKHAMMFLIEWFVTVVIKAN